MSYDIYLKEPIGGEVVQLPIKHVMTGGTYLAEYDAKTGIFSAKPNSEAWLNITYNYSKYYYEAEPDKGIRVIYGMTGLESIPVLEEMIAIITKFHPDKTINENYWQACAGNAIKPLYQLKAMAELRPDAIWDGD